VGEALGPSDFARVRKSILARGAAVAAPVALLISGYFAIWQPTFGSYPWLSQLLVNVSESLGYLVLILVVGNVVLRRWLRPHEAWALGREPISDTLKESLVTLPSRAATAIFVANAIIVLLGSAVNLATNVSLRQDLAYLLGFFLTGFTFAAIVYLQTEATLRPLYRLAFATSLPQRATVGVGTRLIISWAVGSGVPLVFLAIIPLRPAHHRELPIQAPLLYMAIGGLVVGALTAVLAARSVTDPIQAVRKGLERVRDGDLETTVEVTMPGALGALEAGFNNMVEAMRSRLQLEDLFGRHVGEDVARHALDQGVELGGEQREVSVMFVDVIGSSGLAEQMEPKQLVAMLNTLFEIVVYEVAVQSGFVNKFEGDGCLCVFGAPTSCHDHAARALRAARRIDERLKQAGIDAGIGVSTGEAVAGNVGSTRRLEYTVIGYPVHEAARLTEAAKSDRTRLLASMRAVTAAGEEATNWLAHGSQTLRGLREPVDIAAPLRPCIPPKLLRQRHSK
jgi:adenylate cyclase